MVSARRQSAFGHVAIDNRGASEGLRRNARPRLSAGFQQRRRTYFESCVRGVEPVGDSLADLSSEGIGDRRKTGAGSGGVAPSLWSYQGGKSGVCRDEFRRLGETTGDFALSFE